MNIFFLINDAENYFYRFDICFQHFLNIAIIPLERTTNSPLINSILSIFLLYFYTFSSVNIDWFYFIISIGAFIIEYMKMLYNNDFNLSCSNFIF